MATVTTVVSQRITARRPSLPPGGGGGTVTLCNTCTRAQVGAGQGRDRFTTDQTWSKRNRSLLWWCPTGYIWTRYKPVGSRGDTEARTCVLYAAASSYFVQTVRNVASAEGGCLFRQ